MDLDRKARLNILSDINHLAASMSQQLGHVPPARPLSFGSRAKIPELNLPFPTDILAPITAMALPYSVRGPIVRLLEARIIELQRQYINTYKRSCLALLQKFTTDDDFLTMRNMYRTMYMKNSFPVFRSIVTHIMAEIDKDQGASSSEEKRPFNTECTPMLEKYFAYNAYPSAKHQEILAEKTFMTKRQIEVWFQNHRNRAKKDRKCLKRLSTDLPLRLALGACQMEDSFDEGSQFSAEDSANDDSSEDEEDNQASSCIEDFEAFRPKHAFPSVYPPTSSDPFDSYSSVFKNPLSWTRKQQNGSSPLAKLATIDMDELASLFHSKLTLADGTKRRSATTMHRKSHPPWFAARVTVPPPAPHPAFIPATGSSHMVTSSLFASSPIHLPLRQRPTLSTIAFLCFTEQDGRSIRKAPLPPVSLPTSTNDSSPPSSLSSSRSSSFNASHSSHRVSSSSSCSTTPEPGTPPPLPALDIPSVSQLPADIDFRTLFGDDSDSFTPSSYILPFPNDVPSPTLKHKLQPHFVSDSPISFPVHKYVQARS